MINEQSVIGACFLEPYAMDEALAVLSYKDFSTSSHQAIFRTLADMANDGVTPDLVTISTELTKRGWMDQVGGAVYLAELVDFVPSAAQIGYYCRQVKESAKKRRLANVARAIDRNMDLPADELQAKVEAALYDIDTVSTGPESIKGVAKEAFKEVELSWQNRGKITGLETGFLDFDALLNGLNSPDLTIIAGRPAMGKSAFMGNIVEGVSMKTGQTPTLIFSLEMSRAQLVKRMLFGLSHVDGSRARIGNFTDADWPKMAKTFESLSKAPVFIDDTAGLHISELRARARRLQRKEKIGLVCVDYLQLCRGDGDSRVQEIGSITRALKGMAKELCIPVVALCQLSRKVEERTNKRPMMSDLRDSGEIEQDADNIIFLYRDAVYNPSADDGEAEAIIAKQRNGPTGIIPLTWFGGYSRFETRHQGDYQ